MRDPAWQLERSVESEVDVHAVWAFMSDVRNWSDPPATFELEGPFETGAEGVTRTPQQPVRRWRLRAVSSPHAYTIEMPLDKTAYLVSEWRFDAVGGGGTRITQSVLLEGKQAGRYVEEVSRGFASSLAPGMQKIVDAIDRAQGEAS